MTKKQKDMYENYKNAFNRGPKTELHEVYGNYSHKKQEALDYCKGLQERLNGYNGTIVGHSAHFFSYAFVYPDYDSREMCLCYCTHANDYKFSIEEV